MYESGYATNDVGQTLTTSASFTPTPNAQQEQTQHMPSTGFYTNCQRRISATVNQD
jgi:hypothetical protein